MENQSQRFGGIERLYGQDAFKKLSSSHVAVIGIGGVGSWIAEALARSGVGAITLVDLDEVCVTNTNRQLHAMTTTVGQSKVQVMIKRLKDINPDLKAHGVEDFVTESNVAQVLEKESFDLVIDAIDGLKNKALIATTCKKNGLPLIVCGGAGGKTDPTLIKVKDLGLTRDDKLLYRLRKKLKRDFEFPRGRKKFGILAIYSDEKPVFPDGEGGVCETPANEDSTRLDCFSGLGAATHVTASFAMIAAGQAINLLKNNVNQ